MRRILALLMLVSLIGCQSLQGVIDEGGVWPAAAGGSVLDGSPYVYDVPGNFVVKKDEDVCSAIFGWAEPGRYYEGFRLDRPVDGTYGGGVHVEFQGDHHLAWAVDGAPWTIDMHAVVVKGGGGYRVYAYRWAAGGDGHLYDVPTPQADGGLRAPANRGGKAQKIHHVSFCYWNNRLVPLEGTWERQFGAHANATSVVEDWGRVLVAGAVDGALEAGYDHLGGPDVFVTLLDHLDGRTEWVRQFGTQGDDLVHELAIDADGNPLLVGTTDFVLAPAGADHRSILLECPECVEESVNLGGFDAFLMKLDRDGHPLWVRQFGANGQDYANGLAVDAHGRIFVVGVSTPGPHLGPTPGPHLDPDAGFTAFVAKFDPDGTLVWSTSFETPGHNLFATGIAVDGDRNPYVAGSTSVALGAEHHGASDIYVRKLHGDTGEVLWTYQFGTDADDWDPGIVMDRFGFLRVSGNTHGEMTGHFGDRSARSVFVLKMDGDGNEVWRYQFGHGETASDDFVTLNRHLAVDAAGHALLVGSTLSDIGEACDWIDGYRPFFVWLDDDGSERERGEDGTLADDFSHAVSFTHDGYVVIVGNTSGHLAPDDPDEDGMNALVLRRRP
jgi:hypothetical protein